MPLAPAGPAGPAAPVAPVAPVAPAGPGAPRTEPEKSAAVRDLFLMSAPVSDEFLTCLPVMSFDAPTAEPPTTSATTKATTSAFSVMRTERPLIWFVGATTVTNGLSSQAGKFLP